MVVVVVVLGVGEKERSKQEREKGFGSRQGFRKTSLRINVHKHTHTCNTCHASGEVTCQSDAHKKLSCERSSDIAHVTPRFTRTAGCTK